MDKLLCRTVFPEIIQFWTEKKNWLEANWILDLSSYLKSNENSNRS